jgi:hypothetical protein
VHHAAPVCADVPPITPLPAAVSEDVLEDVISGLLPGADSTAAPGDPAEHAAAVTEVVEAATRAVFAPDPLADPGSALAPADGGSSAEAPEAAAARAGVSIRPVETHVDVAAGSPSRSSSRSGPGRSSAGSPRSAGRSTRWPPPTPT